MNLALVWWKIIQNDIEDIFIECGLTSEEIDCLPKEAGFFKVGV
jgi:hypothetical protein